MGLNAEVRMPPAKDSVSHSRFDLPLTPHGVELEKALVKRRKMREVKKGYILSDINRLENLSKSTHPVQRAPSRLYRTVIPPQDNLQSKYCCPNTCIGPEFVVRAASPIKHIRMTDIKLSSGIRSVTVILLNGCRLKVSCGANSTTGQLFEVVVKCEAIEENFTLGLAVLLGGDFVFPPPDFRLSKVSQESQAGFWDECRQPHSPTLAGLLEPFGGQPPLTMYMRTKFFLPVLRGIRSWNMKHQMYLQLRRSLLEQQLRCPTQIQLVSLMGLALQAEFGDFTEKEHGCGDYFLIEHYLPDSMVGEDIALKQQLQCAHRERSGLDPGRAEEMFISQAQRLPEYGAHFYGASCARKSGKDSLVWVAVTPSGVSLHEWRANAGPRVLLQTYQWKDIRKLSYSRQQFCLQPSTGKRLKLRMDLGKSYFTFRLASLHHQFFLKLRAQLNSLRSVAEEFGVPLRKSKITYVESEDAVDSDHRQPDLDARAVFGALASSPVRSQQVVDLSTPPGSACRLNQLSCIIGAAPSGTNGNVEELQNKENERPIWKSRPNHLGRGSFDSLGCAHDMQHVPVSPRSMQYSVSPASTISRTSVHTCLGVTGSEGRTPSFPRRSGVRMGTRAFSLGSTGTGSAQTLPGTGTFEHYRSVSVSAGATPCGTRTPSEYSVPSSPVAEAYVINSSIRSVDEPYHMDSQESISESLAEKIGNISFEDERVLRTIRLQRDRLGSLGIETTEGADGGVYIMSVLRRGDAARLGPVHRGDRVVAVDKHCLLNRRYEDALRLLRTSGEEVELVLSQASRRIARTDSARVLPSVQNGIAWLANCNIENAPVEETYLRDIRYRTEECPTTPHMISTPLDLPVPQPGPGPGAGRRSAGYKKYPAPKPPHMRGVCCIAPVPEDGPDLLGHTI